MPDKSAAQSTPAPAEKTTAKRPAYRRTETGLDRRQLLMNLPRHVLLAVLFGAITGPLIFWLRLIPLESSWRLLLLLPIAAVYVNGAVLPVALPGKHWSFAFICSMLLLLSSVAGAILSTKFNFPHSVMPDGTVLSKVNELTAGAVVTGACLGLFYGLLSEKRSSMIAGAILGAAMGVTLGVASVNVVSHVPPVNVLIYDGALNFAWQAAIAFAALHLAACLGAALGARPGSVKT